MNPIYKNLCLIAVLLCVGLASAEDSAQKLRSNVSEEMNLITKSLEDLLGELSLIKREATGRLAVVKSSAANSDGQAERIRQTKVSKFVLKRVAELENESLGMREDLAKLFKLNSKPMAAPIAEPKQEDHDFEDSQPLTTSVQPQASSSEGYPATSTLKPEEQEEAAKIGFDMEALKKLGADLESEIEARQQQTPESLRGVHEQVIKLVDNMVQNYLGNVRRAIQRMTRFIDHRRASLTSSQPRQSPAVPTNELDNQVESTGRSVLDQIQDLSKSVHEFGIQWGRLIGKQQSPLLDRIPPRGVELWRDFWDTVRKQVRRINQEFRQLTQDMGRMITGRLPTTSSQNLNPGSLLYISESPMEQFQAFYEKMSVALGDEQRKMDSLNRVGQVQSVDQASNLIDENDDESTRNELNRNVALRQQIQQEISIFGSIFDIMSAFMQRLRESATNIRDVLQPGLSNNNNNDPVTPGPSVKPQVDQLLDETIDSQRNINSQGKPVLLPKDRPSVQG